MYFPSFLGQTQTRVLFVTAGLTQNNPVSHIIAGIQVTGYAGIHHLGFPDSASLHVGHSQSVRRA